MNKRLDDDLQALREGELTPLGYNHLETKVWARIADVRRATPFHYAVRAAGIVGALGLGVVGGGATAVAVAGEVQEVSVFSVQTELAPSTLLDHH